MYAIFSEVPLNSAYCAHCDYGRAEVVLSAKSESRTTVFRVLLKQVFAYTGIFEKKEVCLSARKGFLLSSGGISKFEAEVVLSAKIYDSHDRVAPSQYDV